MLMAAPGTWDVLRFCFSAGCGDGRVRVACPVDRLRDRAAALDSTLAPDRSSACGTQIADGSEHATNAVTASICSAHRVGGAVGRLECAPVPAASRRRRGI